MLKIIPLSLAQANQYVIVNHRHNKRVQCHKFSVGLIDTADDGKMHGVAICSNPINIFLDDGYTLEIRRNCTDGIKNRLQ